MRLTISASNCAPRLTTQVERTKPQKTSCETYGEVPAPVDKTTREARDRASRKKSHSLPTRRKRHMAEMSDLVEQVSNLYKNLNTGRKIGFEVLLTWPLNLPEDVLICRALHLCRRRKRGEWYSTVRRPEADCPRRRTKRARPGCTKSLRSSRSKTGHSRHAL
jgi:hypothetical protein